MEGLWKKHLDVVALPVPPTDLTGAVCDVNRTVER